ncbi:hypothetical protein Cci01nite_58890 [Catellatospora citrea]|uniref:Uncharacterized protein n=1 Tax=Catellatospora citrea TaxID=53366 RepID=A0A8J3P1M4_9ACTN|nr:hypothetical protein Cci01nite_58890 [Catellatospora citrea]
MTSTSHGTAKKVIRVPMLETASAAMSLTRSARCCFGDVSKLDQAARTGSVKVSSTADSPPVALSGRKHSIEPRRCVGPVG